MKSNHKLLLKRCLIFLVCLLLFVAYLAVAWHIKSTDNKLVFNNAQTVAGEKLDQNKPLREQQSQFVLMVAQLILFAYENGYELTFGDAWAKDGHCENSFHYKRLAIDLNLFRDSKYLTSTNSHAKLGKFWESIGGSWGGRWGDGNHYSLGENR